MAKVLQKTNLTPSQLKEVIAMCIQHNVNLYIEGPAGLGKTEITKQVCQELGVPLFSRRPSVDEPPDFRGFGVPEKDSNGKLVMQFSRPVDLPPETGKCVFFLDELNRAREDVLNCVMGITDSSKRVGTHQLSKDMTVIAAGNPSNNDYDTGEMDRAQRDRFLHVSCTYSTDDLIAYFSQIGVDSVVTQFLKINKGVLSETCTPRSLERLGQILPAVRLVPKDIGLVMIQGCIGEELGIEFFAFLTDKRPLKFEELLHSEGRRRFKSLCKSEGYRADIIGLTVEDVLTQITGRDIPETVSGVMCFILENVQAEHCAAILYKICNSESLLLQAPAIRGSKLIMERLSKLK